MSSSVGPALAAGVVMVALPYPTRAKPDGNPFTHALARELGAQGLATTVIAPQRRPAAHRLEPRTTVVDGIDVLRPRFSSTGGQGPLRRPRVRLSHRNFMRAALRATASLPVPAFYWGHFLRPSGATAIELGRRDQRPAFVVLGEGEHRSAADEVFGRAANAALLRQATGVLAVSDELGAIARDRYGIEAGRLLVLPNAVDTERFAPGDRAEARRALGLPATAYVVGFVGRFSEAKGPHRVGAALDAVGGDTVGVFLGRGPARPTSTRPTVVRRVPHAEVVTHLHAADVLALPSLQEGCPNAVLEAMACGLPVVVSDRPFMRAIVDEQAAVFVDPADPRAIAEALEGLRVDPERRRALGEAARRRAAGYPLSRRVEDILAWVGDLVTRPGSG